MVSLFIWRTIMRDVFTFVPGVEYTIVLVGSIQLVSEVVDTFDNGIMLSDHTHIPQDKILFFRPNSGTEVA